MTPAPAGPAGLGADGFEPCAGDVLFQAFSSPIADVTVRRPGEAPIAHCALYAGGGEVIEAVFPRVRVTRLDEFLARRLDGSGRPAVLVARPVPPYDRLAGAAVDRARALVGRPYDDAYRHGDGAFYCSELVIDAYRSANGGEPVFEEGPITFDDPATGETSPYWQAHFDRLGMAVPEGAVGSNPAELARSPRLEVVHRYGAA